MKRNEDGDIRPSLEEPEVGFSELGEAPISRARAIKLAGAALAGSALSLFWATDEADARRRRRRRKRRKKRRRRKAQVTPNPVTTLAPGVPTVLQVTNPSDSRPLTVGGVSLVDGDGGLLGSNGLVGAPVQIAPGATAPVTVTFAPDDPIVDASGLRLFDGGGRPIIVVDEEGNILGDVALDLL
jgi:hypothetical protein